MQIVVRSIYILDGVCQYDFLFRICTNILQEKTMGEDTLVEIRSECDVQIILLNWTNILLNWKKDPLEFWRVNCKVISRHNRCETSKTIPEQDEAKEKILGNDFNTRIGPA